MWNGPIKIDSCCPACHASFQIRCSLEQTAKVGDGEKSPIKAWKMLGIVLRVWFRQEEAHPYWNDVRAFIHVAIFTFFENDTQMFRLVILKCVFL